MAMLSNNNPSLRKNGILNRKKRAGRRRSTWPCAEMSAQAWEASEQCCEKCGRAIPFGTPAAHLIPKAAKGETSNELWNLTMLCIAEPQCHSKFDDDRPGATKEEWLKKRMENEPRLQAYFGRLVARAEVHGKNKDLT